MTIRRLPIALFAVVVPIALGAQSPAGIDPSALYQPLGESWPIYSGDYSGRRYSVLKQIDRTTVKQLTLAWTARLAAGPGNAGSPGTAGGGRGGGGRGGGGAPIIVG